MKKLNSEQTLKISGGANGALCFAAGMGMLTIGGPLTALGLLSSAYAIKCWNS